MANDFLALGVTMCVLTTMLLCPHRNHQDKVSCCAVLFNVTALGVNEINT